MGDGTLGARASRGGARKGAVGSSVYKMHDEQLFVCGAFNFLPKPHKSKLPPCTL